MASCNPQPTSDDSVVSVFKEARDEFLLQIDDNSKAEILKLQSMEDMLNHVISLAQKHPIQKSRLTVCAKRIKGFSEKIQPFFDIINIFVSTNPEYSGLLWGTIRLVFQLGSHYVTLLEKLCERFEDISKALPLYKEAAETLQDWKHDTRHRHLRALSLIYSDLIEFLFEAYKLFSGGPGFRAKSRLVWNITWKPFDERFLGILKRVKRHEQLLRFEFELHKRREDIKDVEDSRKENEKMSSHINHISTDLKEQGKIIEKMSQELKRAIPKLNQFLMSVEEDFRQAEDARRNTRDREKQEDHALAIHRLKEWIASPTWEDSHELAQLRRQPRSGQWLFSEPTYQQWCTETAQTWQTRQTTTRRPILHIQAKPGYGKTLLFSTMIDHLKAAGLDIAAEQSCVTGPFDIYYYYFDKLNPKKRDVGNAFRSILTQCLHAHEEDQALVDAGNLLNGTGFSAQRTASDKEILVLLNWCVQRYSQVILALDGMDEAANLDTFVEYLNIAISDLDLSNPDSFAQLKDFSKRITPGPAIVVTSRPDIALKPSFRHQRHQLSLNHVQNQKDIEVYLQNSLKELFEEGVLPKCQNIQELARDAASQSEGMFLWARLLELYLRTDGLTDQDRLYALRNTVYLHDVDEFYNVILSRLQAKPENIRLRTKRAFEWVFGAVRPLLCEELREAIVLPSKSGEDGRIPNPRQAIVRMSGALLEIRPDGSVSFIHSSVKEYLQNCARAEDASNIHLQDAQAEMCLAKACVSYMTEYLPPGPLSGQRTQKADLLSVKRAFPLLQYVVDFWSFHVVKVLNSFQGYLRDMPASPTEEFHEYNGFLGTFYGLVKDKQQVMRWIECSWLFGVPFKTRAVADAMTEDELSSSAQRLVGNMLGTVLNDLRSLTLDLQELEEDWGHVLLDSPNEIWLPSILSMCKSEFWMGTDEATYTRLATDEMSGGRIIPLKSEVSSDGLSLGSLKMVAPSQPDATCKDCRTYRSRKGREPLIEFTMIYEIWDLSSKQMKHRIQEQVRGFEIDVGGFYRCASGHYNLSTHVKIPVSISKDLLRISISYDVIMISATALSTSPTFRHMRLDPWKCETPLTLTEYGNVLSVRGSLFSPDGRYLLFAHYRFGLSVFDLSVPGKNPCPLGKADLGRFDEYLDLEIHRTACFHPSKPFVVASGSTGVFLWAIARPGTPAVKVSPLPLMDMRFLNYGDCIWGSCSIYGDQPKLISLTQAINSFSSSSILLNIAAAFGKILQTQPSEVVPAVSKQSVQGTPASSAIDPDFSKTMSNGSLAFDRDANSGQLKLSMLNQFQKEGKLVMTTLCEAGTVYTEELSRLPRHFDLTQAVLTRPSDWENSETVRIVMNVQGKRDHWLSEAKESPTAPVVLERKKESIPVIETRNVEPRRLGGIFPYRALLSGSLGEHQ